MPRTDQELKNIRDIFREAIPEYSEDDISDILLNRWLDIALDIHSYNELCTVYIAAHLIALSEEEFSNDTKGKIDGGDGIVTQHVVGNISIGYDVGAIRADREAYFNRTPYGRLFLVLEPRVLPRIIVL